MYFELFYFSFWILAPYPEHVDGLTPEFSKHEIIPLGTWKSQLGFFFRRIPRDSSDPAPSPPGRKPNGPEAWPRTIFLFLRRLLICVYRSLRPLTLREKSNWYEQQNVWTHSHRDHILRGMRFPSIGNQFGRRYRRKIRSHDDAYWRTRRDLWSDCHGPSRIQQSTSRGAVPG